MALTDKTIKSARSTSKPYKLFDGGGLYLLVSPTGTKGWKIKYRFKGKEKKLSVGTYPHINLAKARERLRRTKDSLADGIDPSKPQRTISNSFQSIAEEWLGKRKLVWSDKTYTDAVSRLNTYVFPEIGNDGITSIESPDILDCLKKIEARGTHDLAHRVHQYIGQIFRYAIASRKATRNPASDLRGALTPISSQNLAHLSAKELPDFLKKLHKYPGNIITKSATLFLMHTFVRTSEMRFAKWDEIDWDESIWRIPPERMKMRRPHLVPITKQTKKILKQLQMINGDFEYIFATPLSPDKPISENAVLYGIYRMGYKDRTTGHGFRSTASTILNENGFLSDAIERQLAHLEGNSVKRAYNHAEHLPLRRKMMQWWSDYLDAA